MGGATSRRAFRARGILGVSLSLAPRTFWRLGFRRARLPQNQRTVWVQSELMRQSARDMAEAGREIGRFDSRPWLGAVRAPIAVLVTTRDQVVPVHKQRDLAAADGPVLDSPIDHLDVGTRADEYTPRLLQAIAAVRPGSQVNAAAMVR